MRRHDMYISFMGMYWEQGSREAVRPQSPTAVSFQEEADGQDTESIFQETVTEPEVIEADWSGYFDGRNGAP